MLWERLTFSDRFEFVDQKKIVHVVMDDAVDKKKIASDEWYHELKQTDIGVQRVKTWSQFDGHLEDGDIFISADVDEVMSGAALHQLRWCETKQVRGQGGGDKDCAGSCNHPYYRIEVSDKVTQIPN